MLVAWRMGGPDGLWGHEVVVGGPEAVTPVTAVVCDLTPCSLVFRNPRFGVTRSLCLQGGNILKPEDAFGTSGRLIIPDSATQPIL